MKRPLQPQPIVATFGPGNNNFVEAEHPRGRDGKFIKKGGRVLHYLSIFDNAPEAGWVEHADVNDPDNVIVKLDNGKRISVPSNTLEAVPAKAFLPGTPGLDGQIHHDNATGYHPEDFIHPLNAKKPLEPSVGKDGAIRSDFRELMEKADVPFQEGTKIGAVETKQRNNQRVFDHIERTPELDAWLDKKLEDEYSLEEYTPLTIGSKVTDKDGNQYTVLENKEEGKFIAVDEQNKQHVLHASDVGHTETYKKLQISNLQHTWEKTAPVDLDSDAKNKKALEDWKDSAILHLSSIAEDLPDKEFIDISGKYLIGGHEWDELIALDKKEITLADFKKDNPHFANKIAQHARQEKADGYTGPFDKMPVPDDKPQLLPFPDDPREVILRSEIRKTIDGWAGTSGDSDPHAISLQRAAQELFGTGDLTSIEQHEPMAWENATKYLEENGPMQKAVLAAMYRDTQEDLKKRNISEVAIFRGMGAHDEEWGKRPDEPDRKSKRVIWIGDQKYSPNDIHPGGVYDDNDDLLYSTVLFDKDDSPVPDAPHFDNPEDLHDWYDKEFEKSYVQANSDNRHVTLQPLSSWASEESVAHEFMPQQNPVLLSAVIPRERLISSAVLGLGCLNENEYIVLGHEGDVHIEWGGGYKGENFNEDFFQRHDEIGQKEKEIKDQIENTQKQILPGQVYKFYDGSNMGTVEKVDEDGMVHIKSIHGPVYELSPEELEEIPLNPPQENTPTSEPTPEPSTEFSPPSSLLEANNENIFYHHELEGYTFKDQPVGSANQTVFATDDETGKTYFLKSAPGPDTANSEYDAASMLKGWTTYVPPVEVGGDPDSYEEDPYTVSPHLDDVFPNGSGPYSPNYFNDISNKEDIPKLALFDFASNNKDRHDGNFLFGYDEKGDATLVPIDHGYNFMRDYDEDLGEETALADVASYSFGDLHNAYGPLLNHYYASKDPEEAYEELQQIKDDLRAHLNSHSETLNDDENHAYMLERLDYLDDKESFNDVFRKMTGFDPPQEHNIPSDVKTDKPITLTNGQKAYYLGKDLDSGRHEVYIPEKGDYVSVDSSEIADGIDLPKPADHFPASLKDITDVEELPENFRIINPAHIAAGDSTFAFIEDTDTGKQYFIKDNSSSANEDTPYREELASILMPNGAPKAQALNENFSIADFIKPEDAFFKRDYDQNYDDLDLQHMPEITAYTLIANERDAHAGNIVIGPDKTIYSIDHGGSFSRLDNPTFQKLADHSFLSLKPLIDKAIKNDPDFKDKLYQAVEDIKDRIPEDSPYAHGLKSRANLLLDTFDNFFETLEQEHYSPYVNDIVSIRDPKTGSVVAEGHIVDSGGLLGSPRVVIDHNFSPNSPYTPDSEQSISKSLIHPTGDVYEAPERISVPDGLPRYLDTLEDLRQDGPHTAILHDPETGQIVARRDYQTGDSELVQAQNYDKVIRSLIPSLPEFEEMDGDTYQELKPQMVHPVPEDLRIADPKNIIDIALTDLVTGNDKRSLNDFIL